MHRFFVERPFRGRLIVPEFSYIFKRVERSYEKAFDYYRKYNVYIPNDHILMKLIGSFALDPSWSAMAAHRHVEKHSDNIATALNITNPSNPGRWHDREFYVEHCVIYSTNLGNPFSFDRWEDIVAVRPLTHPHYTLECVHPHRLESVKKTDYAVVAIDLPLLAYQYSEWSRVNRQKDIGDNLTEFISKYVMPNMWKAQIEISLRNRMVGQALGIERDEPDLKPPMGLVRQDDELERAYAKQLELLNTTSRSLFEVMGSIPMLFSENYFEAVPKGVSTVSVYAYWASLIAYTDWLYAIVATIDDIKGREENVYRTAKAVRRFIRGRLQERFIHRDVRPFIEGRIETVLEILEEN